MIKKVIKSYLVFTSFLYRLAIFVILPLAMLAISIALSMGMGRKSYFVTPYLIPVFLIMVEVVADNWMFGGIQAKYAERMDVLRTSGRGMKVIKDALALDLIRRLLSMAGITALCLLAETLLMGGTAAGVIETVPILLGMLFFCYDLSVLGTLAARFGTFVWINCLIGYAGVVAGTWGGVAMSLPERGVVPAIVLAVLAVPVSALTVRAAMKKVRGGYYDK